MRNIVEVLGVKVDCVTMKEALECVWKFLSENKLHMIFTPNPEIIMTAQQDKNLKSILNKGDLNTADGIGIVYASRLLKKPVKERVAGFDLASEILKQLPHKRYSLFLFGGKPGVAEKAKENLEAKYKGIKICGTRNGYFDESDEENIIKDINNSGADILLVCLGMSKQEKWIYNNSDKLKVKVCMGIGGSIDVFAGTVKRAPAIYQKLNIEWLYRLIKQPWRIKRMMVLPKFMIKVMKKSSEN